MVRDKSTLPFKDAMKHLNLNLQAENPMASEWVIRKKHKGKDLDDGQSIASSYMLSSVLSAASKRFNIDNIISEQEGILDWVQKIDQKLGEDADVKKTKM